MIDYATVLHLSICRLLSVTLCIVAKRCVLEQSYWEAEIPGVESELNFNILRLSKTIPLSPITSAVLIPVSK